jgi:hypothetical protein
VWVHGSGEGRHGACPRPLRLPCLLISGWMVLVLALIPGSPGLPRPLIGRLLGVGVCGGGGGGQRARRAWGERRWPVSRRFHIVCGRLDWDLPVCCVFLS